MTKQLHESGAIDLIEVRERFPRFYREILVPMTSAGQLSAQQSHLSNAIAICQRVSPVLGRCVTVYERAEDVFDEVERRLSRAYTSHAENAGNG